MLLMLLLLIFPVNDIFAQDIFNNPQTVDQAIRFNTEIPSNLSLTLGTIANNLELNTEELMTKNYDPRTRNHRVQYLYGQCILDLHTSLLKERLPLVPEKKIEDYLINSNVISFRKRKTIEAEFCRYNYNFELEDYGSGLKDLIEDSGGILAELNRELIRPNVLAQIKAEAELCQKEEEKEHRAAMLASNGIYTGNKPPDGWETVDVFEDVESGLYAEIQRELKPRYNKKAKIMVVFRGTEMHDEGDGKANFTYGFHQLYNPDTKVSPGRIDYSDIMEKLMPYIQGGHEIVFTGHSLGGGLAQGQVYLVDQVIANSPSLDGSLRRNLSSVTFGSFGAGPLIEMINDHTVTERQATNQSNLVERLNYIGVNQTNYISENDVIPALGYFPTGQTRKLYFNEEKSLNPYKNHTIEKQIEWLKSDQAKRHGLAGAYPLKFQTERSFKVKITETIANFVQDDKSDGEENEERLLFNLNYDDSE
ncbi:MAG: hypothetical protein VYA54_08560 [Bdellovibrionota bacterium]|nr:hypothetical protein [Bdellovibrionota bacterium]